jgi:hypothetical protein
MRCKPVRPRTAEVVAGSRRAGLNLTNVPTLANPRVLILILIFTASHDLLFTAMVAAISWLLQRLP